MRSQTRGLTQRRAGASSVVLRDGSRPTSTFCLLRARAVCSPEDCHMAAMEYVLFTLHLSWTEIGPLCLSVGLWCSTLTSCWVGQSTINIAADGSQCHRMAPVFWEIAVPLAWCLGQDERQQDVTEKTANNTWHVWMYTLNNIGEDFHWIHNSLPHKYWPHFQDFDSWNADEHSNNNNSYYMLLLVYYITCVIITVLDYPCYTMIMKSMPQDCFYPNMSIKYWTVAKQESICLYHQAIMS